MTDIKLVPMKEAHIGRIVDIERSVFTSPWSEEMFVQEVRGVFGSRAIVAVMDAVVVGYRIAWFIDREVHLVNIAVADSHQNRGVGTLMLTDLVGDALRANMKLITLEVRESNEAAQAFYRRFLFRTIGIRKGYYSDNREDALLMMLDLDDARRKGHGESNAR